MISTASKPIAAVSPIALPKITNEILEDHGTNDEHMDNDGWDFDEEDEKEEEITAVPVKAPANIPQTSRFSRIVPTASIPTAAMTPPVAPPKVTNEIVNGQGSNDNTMQQNGWNFIKEKDKEAAFRIPTTATAKSTAAATAPPRTSSGPNKDDIELIGADEEDAGWDFEDEEELAVDAGSSDVNVVQHHQPPPIATSAQPPPPQAPPTTMIPAAPSRMIPAPALTVPPPHTTTLAAPALLAPSNNSAALGVDQEKEEIYIGDADNGGGWDFDEDAVVSASAAQDDDDFPIENTMTLQHAPPAAAAAAPPEVVATFPSPVLPTNTSYDAVVDDGDDAYVDDDVGGGWDFDEYDLGLEPSAAAAAAAVHVGEAGNNIEEQDESGGEGGWDFDDI
jgi:hypothetical protein